MAIVDKETSTKIYTEDKKTVFANWLTVNPGETKEILLVYKLPFKLNFSKEENEPDSFWGKIKAAFTSTQATYDSYSLLVQKQPGSNDDYFSGKVEYPNNTGVQIVYPDNVENSDSGSVYETKLAEDLFYFVGLIKK